MSCKGFKAIFTKNPYAACVTRSFFRSFHVASRRLFLASFRICA